MPDPSPNIGDLLRTYWSQADPVIFKTGLYPLDQRVQLVPASVNIIGGRSSEGKTSLALYICRRMAEQGTRVMFLSIEMTALELTERLVCQWLDKSRDQLQAWREAKQLEAQLTPIAKRADAILKFQIRDDMNGEIEEIKLILEALKKSNEPLPQVLAIDHLQQVWLPEGASRADALAAYMRDLKLLAKAHGLAIILCSQLNRQAETTRDKSGNMNPQPWHLKSSGAIEEMADTVLLCWRKSMDKDLLTDTGDQPGEYVIRIAKNRNGPTGEVTILFHPSHFTFLEAEAHWPSGQQDAAGPVEI